MIRLEDVTVRIGDVEALSAVSLDLDARTVAVVGDNGSGKSTLARLLAGLVPATSGSVCVLGLDPARDVAELRRRVAVVFSNPDAQIVMPTVAEDVAFSLRPRERRSRGIRSRGIRRGGRGDAGTAGLVAQTLDRFGLAALADRPSHDLSGGQKQLLALAGAFVRRPDLVIADEPTAFLDARNARIVAEHLLADTGHRLVLATHDLGLARRCDLAVLCARGRVEATGEAGEIVTRYRASLPW